MSKIFDVRVDAEGGVRLPTGAALGKIAVSNANGDIAWLTAAEANLATTDDIADFVTTAEIADLVTTSDPRLDTALADDHAGANVVNTAVETNLAQLAIPTTVAAGDILDFTLRGDQLNNSGGNVVYTFKFYIGATALTSAGFTASTSANRRRVVLRAKVLVVAPTNDQRIGAEVVFGSAGSATMTFGAGSLAVGDRTTAENLTAGKNLTVSVTMDTAALTADFRSSFSTLQIAKR